MKIIILFSFLLLPLVSSAKCNTNAIGVIKQSGWGISIGAGGTSAGSYDKDVVNVPLTINGEQACFKKKNSYKIESKEKNKMTISPMKVDFENVPAPHYKQYIFVEKAADTIKTKIITMNFICTGEIPLSIESMANSLFNIQNSNDINVESSNVFATGAAAKNLSTHSSKNSSEAFSFFTQLYQSKTPANNTSGADFPCCNDIKIPSIISQSSVNALSGMEKAIASQFTTLASNVPNGCSNDFSQKMKAYLLENYSENESLKEFKINKKWISNDLVFEW